MEHSCLDMVNISGVGRRTESFSIGITCTTQIFGYALLAGTQNYMPASFVVESFFTEMLGVLRGGKDLMTEVTRMDRK